MLCHRLLLQCCLSQLASSLRRCRRPRATARSCPQPTILSVLCAAQQLPTWDCQRQGPCTYYHSSPASQGCDQQPPQCVPAAGGSTGSGAAGSIAGSEGCSARNKNYQGDVLVLDVNSMQYQGNCLPSSALLAQACFARKAPCCRLSFPAAGCTA